MADNDHVEASTPQDETCSGKETEDYNTCNKNSRVTKDNKDTKDNKGAKDIKGTEGNKDIKGGEAEIAVSSSSQNISLTVNIDAIKIDPTMQCSSVNDEKDKRPSEDGDNLVIDADKEGNRGGNNIKSIIKKDNVQVVIESPRDKEKSILNEKSQSTNDIKGKVPAGRQKKSAKGITKQNNSDDCEENPKKVPCIRTRNRNIGGEKVGKSEMCGKQATRRSSKIEICGKEADAKGAAESPKATRRSSKRASSMKSEDDANVKDKKEVADSSTVKVTGERTTRSQRVNKTNQVTTPPNDAIKRSVGKRQKEVANEETKRITRQSPRKGKTMHDSKQNINESKRGINQKNKESKRSGNQKESGSKRGSNQKINESKRGGNQKEGGSKRGKTTRRSMNNVTDEEEDEEEEDDEGEVEEEEEKRVSENDKIVPDKDVNTAEIKSIVRSGIEGTADEYLEMTREEEGTYPLAPQGNGVVQSQKSEEAFAKVDIEAVHNESETDVACDKDSIGRVINEKDTIENETLTSLQPCNMLQPQDFKEEEKEASISGSDPLGNDDNNAIDEREDELLEKSEREIDITEDLENINYNLSAHIGESSKVAPVTCTVTNTVCKDITVTPNKCTVTETNTVCKDVTMTPDKCTVTETNTVCKEVTVKNEFPTSNTDTCETAINNLKYVVPKQEEIVPTVLSNTASVHEKADLLHVKEESTEDVELFPAIRYNTEPIPASSGKDREEQNTGDDVIVKEEECSSDETKPSRYIGTGTSTGNNYEVCEVTLVKAVSNIDNVKKDTTNHHTSEILDISDDSENDNSVHTEMSGDIEANPGLKFSEYPRIESINTVSISDVSDVSDEERNVQTFVDKKENYTSDVNCARKYSSNMRQEVVNKDPGISDISDEGENDKCNVDERTSRCPVNKNSDISDEDENDKCNVDERTSSYIVKKNSDISDISDSENAVKNISDISDTENIDSFATASNKGGRIYDEDLSEISDTENTDSCGTGSNKGDRIYEEDLSEISETENTGSFAAVSRDDRIYEGDLSEISETENTDSCGTGSNRGDRIYEEDLSEISETEHTDTCGPLSNRDTRIHKEDLSEISEAEDVSENTSTAAQSIHLKGDEKPTSKKEGMIVKETSSHEVTMSEKEECTEDTDKEEGELSDDEQESIPRKKEKSHHTTHGGERAKSSSSRRKVKDDNSQRNKSKERTNRSRSKERTNRSGSKERYHRSISKTEIRSPFDCDFQLEKDKDELSVENLSVKGKSDSRPSKHPRSPSHERKHRRRSVREFYAKCQEKVGESKEKKSPPREKNSSSRSPSHETNREMKGADEDISNKSSNSHKHRENRENYGDSSRSARRRESRKDEVNDRDKSTRSLHERRATKHRGDLRDELRAKKREEPSSHDLRKKLQAERIKMKIERAVRHLQKKEANEGERRGSHKAKVTSQVHVVGEKSDVAEATTNLESKSSKEEIELSGRSAVWNEKPMKDINLDAVKRYEEKWGRAAQKDATSPKRIKVSIRKSSKDGGTQRVKVKVSRKKSDEERKISEVESNEKKDAECKKMDEREHRRMDERDHRRMDDTDQRIMDDIDHRIMDNSDHRIMDNSDHRIMDDSDQRIMGNTDHRKPNESDDEIVEKELPKPSPSLNPFQQRHSALARTQRTNETNETNDTMMESVARTKRTSTGTPKFTRENVSQRNVDSVNKKNFSSDLKEPGFFARRMQHRMQTVQQRETKNEQREREICEQIMSAIAPMDCQPQKQVKGSVFKQRHVNQMFIRGDNIVMIAYENPEDVRKVKRL